MSRGIPLKRKLPAQSRWTHQAVQARSQKTMERILDATEKLMRKRPFREIAVAEIAQEARAAPTSLYARFENKQAILGALFERHAHSHQQLFDQLAEPGQWNGVPLAIVLRKTFPAIVDSYRARQGLLRAFLEQAAEDRRFREDWSRVGQFIEKTVLGLVLARPDEVGHPDPVQGVRVCMEAVFATLSVRVLMHAIDGPEVRVLTEEMIGMMLRYMGIRDPQADVPLRR
ncbi:MAG: TetR/AcrR family transcriptional regulator [Planctomycetota bacterium]